MEVFLLLKYMEAMGGKLRIGVELPAGKYISFSIK
jgi:hypothetical protein